MRSLKFHLSISCSKSQFTYIQFVSHIFLPPNILPVTGMAFFFKQVHLISCRKVVQQTDTEDALTIHIANSTKLLVAVVSGLSILGKYICMMLSL